MNKREEFSNFLTDIDRMFAEYFSTKPESANTIRKCFATHNDIKLVYNKYADLKKDIYDEVVSKHKEIYGSEAFVVTSN